jgi:ankyrin repeat protein
MKHSRPRRALFIVVAVLAAFLMTVSLTLYGSNRKQRDTDLILALNAGDVDDARSQLDSGANPNARDLPDAGPRTAWQQILDMFGPHEPSNNQAPTALSCATGNKQHSYELVKLLLERGASIAKDEECLLPALGMAARQGETATVKLLLEHGAHVNTTDQGRSTPLEEAVGADSPELVQLLLDHGAQVSSRDLAPVFAGRPHHAQIIAMLTHAGKTR